MGSEMCIRDRDSTQRVTMFQPELEYDRIMTMFGGKGVTVRDPEVLQATLQNAIASGSSCCINVLVDPEMPLPNAWGEQDKGMETD